MSQNASYEEGKRNPASTQESQNYYDDDSTDDYLEGEVSFSINLRLQLFQS